MKISIDAIPLCYAVECLMENLEVPGVDIKKAPPHLYLMLSPRQVIDFLTIIFDITQVCESDQAKLLSLSIDDLTRWRETGKVIMTLPLSYQCRALFNIYRELRQRCEDEDDIRIWMHEPQQAFLMRTPLAYMIATEPGFGLDRLNKLKETVEARDE